MHIYIHIPTSSSAPASHLSHSSFSALLSFCFLNHNFSNPFDRSTPSHRYPGLILNRFGGAMPIYRGTRLFIFLLFFFDSVDRNAAAGSFHRSCALSVSLYSLSSLVLANARVS